MSYRQPLNFPKQAPPEYIKLQAEPQFNPSIHLQLEQPEQLKSLAELGYNDTVIATLPSDFGVCSAFRILSAEGVATLYELCKRLENNKNASAATGKSRLGSFIRGAGYRSQFIKDFCECSELAEHLSQLAGVQLGSHSVPAVACGINYAPEDISKAVDTWHVDSVPFDVVMLMVDPSTLDGGEFQYFLGTKEEGAELLGIAGEEGSVNDLPSERVVTIPFAQAGFGFMQQGNMIFHRACKLNKAAERITMIPAFNVLNADQPDYTNYQAMMQWQDTGIIAELARHEAWLGMTELQQLIDGIDLFADRQQTAASINRSIARLQDYAQQLSAD